MHKTDVMEQYRIDSIGAPFSVVLERSVGIVHGSNGPTPVIPDLAGLVYETCMARAWHPRSVSGADLLFFRKAMEISRSQMAMALGASEADMDSYEEGNRAVPASLDKLSRIHVCHSLSGRMRAGEKRRPCLMTWIFEEYRHSPMHDPNEDICFVFRYEDTQGWIEDDSSHV